MNTWILASSLAVLLFLGAFSSSYAQEIAGHVVINEVDTNPPGNDAITISEWVELHNPTNEEVDIGGWKIASTTILKKTFTIPPATKIKPGQFLAYSYTSLWFTDVSEKVQLRDGSGNVIDETPVITDQKNDFSSWQRNFDGVDSNSTDDWIFRKSSAGSSNGKLVTGEGGAGELSVLISTDASSYAFGDTATILGKVSKRIYQEKPYFSQQQVAVHVDGPGSYDRKLTLYPDSNLEFKTSTKLDKVLGIDAGTYKVSASYGGIQEATEFSVGEKAEEASVKEESELVISTDKESYIPGQRVKISASTSKIIPLQGLQYEVFDPKKIRIFSGKLYPTPNGEFSGQVFMNTVNPVYGIFRIVADYGKQHAETAFELTQVLKEKENIALTTDKKVYGLGEPIIISGKSSKHVVALDLEVLQTGMVSTKDTNTIFKLRDQVTLAGDSSFEYELKIPGEQARLGDYGITVSKDFGKAVVYFKIVENPDDYLVPEEKEFVSTDKVQYDGGEKLTITGHVIPKPRSTYQTVPVSISIKTESGKGLTIVAQDKKMQTRDPTNVAAYVFTAIPDQIGNYKIDTTLSESIFTPGNYIIQAKYEGSVTSTKFAVVSKLDTSNKSINASLDKSIYGLGETVNLKGSLLSGQSAVRITLTKPDGKTINGGAAVDSSKFSWSWQIPQTDYSTADILNQKGPRPTVFGNYKITISAASETTDVYFKVSKTPETDTLDVKPIDVKTDKPSYIAGEKLTVLGSAIKREQTTSSAGVIIPDRINIQVRTNTNKVIYDTNVGFDNIGNFETKFDLPLTIFKEGTYKVSAAYRALRAQTTFEVKSAIPIDGQGQLTLTINTDKEEYFAGDTIKISGGTNRIISLGHLDLVILPEGKPSCGTFECGLGGKKIDIIRYFNNGLYSYDYKIPDSVAPATYVIKVDTDFGVFTKTIKVIEVKVPEKQPSVVSEKFNRITDSVIEIPIFEKKIQDQAFAPLSVQGSVVTTRGFEKSVNIKITADDGTCIIGQDKDCLVSQSTKNGGVDYKVVSLAGTGYKVTYSGPEPFLEKFSIMPESGVIPDSAWTVEIIKENQPSKFYYEITYGQLQ